MHALICRVCAGFENFFPEKSKDAALKSRPSQKEEKHGNCIKCDFIHCSYMNVHCKLICVILLYMCFSV